MKESKCPTDSSSSNDREVTRNHQRGNHLLSDICRYLEVAPGRKSSRENVELGLEIEINESLKRVLTTPNSGSDDLLDVTIIRPSESDVTHETTVALNKDEVRDFITLVEQHHQNKLKSSAKPKKNNKHYEDDVPDHIPAKHPKELRDQGATKGNVIKHAFEDPRSGSSRSQQAEKPGTPCVCQHCGIMGVLVQSHKSQGNTLPQTDENKKPRKVEKEDKRKKRDKSTEQLKEPKEKETKEYKDTRTQHIVEIVTTKSTEQVELLREINTRIKSLERRIAVQEETAVPRDYLKHVLHKVLTQYKVQSEQLQQQQRQQKLRNTGTQYAVESREKYPSHHKKDGRGRHYQVHTLLHTPTVPLAQLQRVDIGEPSTTSHNSQETTKPGPHKTRKDPIYFWGEEIVKPGCDLKNKILNLLEEKIGKPDTSHTESLKPLQQSKIPIALPEKLPKAEVQQEIRVERDDKLLLLGKMDDIPPCNIDDYVHRTRHQELIKPLTDRYGSHQSRLPVNTGSSVVPESLRQEAKCRQRFSTFNKGAKNLKNELNPTKQEYPFDPKRTVDDSTFRKNIEAHKEKLKDKPKVEGNLFNTYTTPSATTESKTSMEYVLQKLKNNTFEPNVAKGKERQFGNRFNVNQYAKRAGSIMKDNLTRGFRPRKPVQHNSDDFFSVPVDVTYINPKITHWSEESTASEDKYMKYMRPNEKVETLPVETKESLIYKLEFLKNLAKHKSADQSKVLNKIWTQAKKTAKSKNDAVFIKIPFKSVNTVEPRNNVIEMQLTLEQLETVVKSVKVNGSTGKIANYKSSSDIDLGQRRHEEIKKANMEMLNRRKHLSAKTNRNKK